MTAITRRLSSLPPMAGHTINLYFSYTLKVGSSEVRRGGAAGSVW